MKSFVGSETVLFDYMRAQGIPVYHKSNLFVRDVQAAIRGYMRDITHKDIGTLAVDRLAEEFLADLRTRGIAVPYAGNAFTLHLDSYQLKPRKEEQAAEETAGVVA
ncbi:MAG: hypothetical protein RBU27_02345 [Bacteroidota bacterium]|jgi:hypothetical protein|nr:hypothetical protein [Bacteroidota bacterium]